MGLGGLGDAATALAKRVPGKPICRGPTPVATLLSTLQLRLRAHPGAAALHNTLLAQSLENARRDEGPAEKLGASSGRRYAERGRGQAGFEIW